MRTVMVGAKGRFTFNVEPRHLANQFKDAVLPPVLATPIMVLAMENAALNAIRECLDPDECAVGTVVDIRHTAPTPVGQRVIAEAEVTGVEGRHVIFAVSAHDEIEEIGRGTHERTVVNFGRLVGRIDAKLLMRDKSYEQESKAEQDSKNP